MFSIKNVCNWYSTLKHSEVNKLKKAENCKMGTCAMKYKVSLFLFFSQHLLSSRILCLITNVTVLLIAWLTVWWSSLIFQILNLCPMLAHLVYTAFSSFWITLPFHEIYMNVTLKENNKNISYRPFAFKSHFNLFNHNFTDRTIISSFPFS